MPDLEPITRAEKFLNGEVGMTPITREEKILAGEDVETITRREYFLKKYRGGGGDVTVVPLRVTENGTYSEEGKAYSPVQVSVPDPVLKTKNITENGIYDASDDSADGYSNVNVNVPLPQNAYLLKSVANLPQAIASFSDGEEMVMPSLKVAIEPQQEGSGDPSPTNVRPISGWDATNVVRAGKNFLNMTEYDSLTNCTYNNGAFTATSRSNLAGAFVRLFKNGSVVRTISKQAVAGGIFESALTFDDTWDSMIVGYLMLAQNIAVNYIKPSVPNGDYTISFKTDILPSLSVDGVFSNIQIEKNNIATAYEPYAGTTYTIALGDTYYGGYIDWENNRIVATNTYVTFDSSENWSYYRSDGSTPYNTFQTNILAKFGVAILEAWGSDTKNNALCDSYICNGGTVYNHNGNAFAIDGTSVYFSTEVANTIEAFKTYISEHNIGLLATLATPITIQLTPTAVKSLLGSNNVWADTGDITDAEYFSKEV